MKIRLICAIAFTVLLQGSAFAQEAVSTQRNETPSPCPNFPMPVIKPEVDENKLPIVKPDSTVDYKLIIVDPCASAIEQKSNSLFPVVPQPKNNGSLQLSVTPLKRNENNFTITPKENVTQSPVFTPKQPK